MNPGNIWWLAESGDVEGLRNAIKRLPSCLDVCGWSYDQAGSRRGIVATEGTKSDGTSLVKWGVGTDPSSFAAPMLYYAVAACQPHTTCLILSSGADPTISLQGGCPLQVATAYRPSKDSITIVEALQAAINRKGNPLMAIESDETHARTELSRIEEESRNYIYHAEQCGTVEVVVEIRGFGFDKEVHSITFPRSGTFTNFRSKVEVITRCRVVLSFICKEAAKTGQRASKIPTTAVEITPRTFEKFISKKRCSCIARPVTYAVGDDENTSTNSSSNKTRIAKAIREYESSPQRRSSKLAELKRDLDNEERTFHTEHNQIQFKRKIMTSSELEEATKRLYDIPFARQQQRSVEFNEEIQRAIDVSSSAHCSGIGKYLDEAQQESVDRLFGYAAEREEKFAEKDEALWSQIPQPHVSELEEEEREAIQARLVSNTRPATLKQLETRIYGKPPPRKLTKKEQEQLVDSSYYSAVRKKAENLKQAENVYGDFRSRKKPSTKITLSQLGAMANRLSTRK